MIVIPAIDIIDGSLVRLEKGDYGRSKIYSATPVDVAKAFEGAGLKRLHLVDLDGAKSDGIRNLRVLEEIKRETCLTVDFGGGIKRDEDIESAFSAGADFITCGSIAVKDREKTLSWLEKYRDKLILGADSMDGNVRISGWREGEGIDVIGFIKSYENLGFSSVIATDISKDGMLSGPSFILYAKIMEKCGMPLIASGGVSSRKDLESLGRMGLYGAIVGKAYYEGRITLDEMKEAESAC